MLLVEVVNNTCGFFFVVIVAGERVERAKIVVIVVRVDLNMRFF